MVTCSFHKVNRLHAINLDLKLQLKGLGGLKTALSIHPSMSAIPTIWISGRYRARKSSRPWRTYRYGHASSRGVRGTPYNGLYGEAPPERGTFFRLEVCERVGISRIQVWERVGKTAI